MERLRYPNIQCIIPAKVRAYPPSRIRKIRKGRRENDLDLLEWVRIVTQISPSNRQR